jgi:long-chain acyl-CoA synthetase
MSALHFLTLGDVTRERARSWPNAIALVDGEVRISYRELDQRTNRLANALRDSGVGLGDRVLWTGQNSFRIVELLLAAAKIGAVLCVANWRQTTEEFEFIIGDLEPTVIVWQGREVGDSITAARETAGPAARWVRHDDDGRDSYEALLASGTPEDPYRDTAPDGAVLALYTAAFDGHPNAALLSHEAVIAHNMSIAVASQMEPGFTYLSSGPMFHIGTMFFVLATVQLAGKNVVMARFDAREACRLIEEERCDSMLLIPSMMDEMVAANSSGTYDLSTLRAMSGSDEWNAMVTPDTSPWGRALGGYGQTEVAGMLTLTGYGLGGIGSHGRPSPLVQVRIVDPNGDDVPVGTIGEIVARGPHLMSGYYNRPELNHERQAGDWHHTGDLGRRETDGTISFVGPKLRMIKSGAENIYPVEVERCIALHPDVAACAVIGVPDPKWGQTVKAIVVRADGATVDAAGIIEHCRAHIASYKKPTIVEFVDEIPRRGFAPDYDVLDEKFGGGNYPGSTGA